MKIGFVGRWSPLDKAAWSGIYYHSYKAIQTFYTTECFYYKWPWHIREYLMLHKQYQKNIHKKAAVEFLTSYAKYFSKQLENDLKKRKVDLLFVPSAPQLVAYCKTNIPIVYMTDATFFQLQNYYPIFQEMANYNILQGIKMDKLVFNKAAHCIMNSDWAKKSALKDYSIPKNKVSVVPLGANIEKVPFINELQNEKNAIGQLLFLGVDWERKGGQLALDTFYTLQKKGIAVKLTIVGCLPPFVIKNEHITIIPFIDKHSKTGERELYTILLQSDILLLPTRAECAGVVFCEAAAFGLPIITTNTGGISTLHYP
jgi:glycosyltransferase involved in cell wall biosynthesis